jgi:WD40 repeat protein
VTLVVSYARVTASNAQITAKEGEATRALTLERDAREEERQTRERERHLLYLARVPRAGRLWASNHATWADGLDECPPEFRNWEWHFLKSLCQPEHLLKLDHDERVCALAYNGRYLASAGPSGRVKLWNPQTGEPVPCSITHGTGVGCLAFHPFDPLLATVSSRSVKVWNVETGKELFQFDGRHWAVFSRDGRYLASARGKVLKIWDVRTGSERYSLGLPVKFVSAGTF